MRYVYGKASGINNLYVPRLNTSVVPPYYQLPTNDKRANPFLLNGVVIMALNVTSGSIERDGFSVTETAARYGVSPGLVRLEILRGKLKAIKIGRRVVIPREAISAWLHGLGD